MSALDDLDGAVERCHQALGEFVKGNPAPFKTMMSHRPDVTLANPFGPVTRGWEQVEQAMERAASLYRDGELTGFESVAKHVTPDLAYVVEIERFRAKVAGREEAAAIALRVTSVLRPEDGSWKVVHRHADPITTAQPPDSVIRH